MANLLPSLPSLFILLIVSTLRSTISGSAVTQATSTVAKELVPCAMCAECENPCQPLPPPPPPVIECPPPPLPPPSPPPPSPPPPPAVVECPPPPERSCPDNCEQPPMTPQGPPGPPYPPGSYYPPYFPPGTPFPYYVPHNYNNCGKMVPFSAMFFWNPSSYFVYFATQNLVYVAFLCLPYYLFI